MCSIGNLLNRIRYLVAERKALTILIQNFVQNSSFIIHKLRTICPILSHISKSQENCMLA